MHPKRVRILMAGLAVLLSTTFCILTPRPALEFKPDQLPAAHLGQAYQVDILVAGNETPVGNYSIQGRTTAARTQRRPVCSWLWTRPFVSAGSLVLPARPVRSSSR